MNALYIILGIIVFIGLFFWFTYNGLIKLNERVNEAWSTITIQLKYRADLIPNVIETVKGYAKHEKELFAEITKARGASMSAGDPKSASVAEAAMQGAITKILAVAESYPDLKANQNFVKLQDQLQDVEDKIQAARYAYNNGAASLNIKIKLFPTNLIAGMLGFNVREYFEVPEEEKAKIEQAPTVKF